MYLGDNFKSAQTFFKSDISGAAKFTLCTKSQEKLKYAYSKNWITTAVNDLFDSSGNTKGLDLYIDSIGWSYNDTFKIDPMVGNLFHVHYLGRNPIVASISGSIIDLYDSNAKKNLMLLYKHLFRMTAIAANSVIPTLECMGYFIDGGMESIELIEHANKADLITFHIQYNVFKLTVTNKDNKSGSIEAVIDFVNGDNS
jgi:hypothetical protein